MPGVAGSLPSGAATARYAFRARVERHAATRYAARAAAVLAARRRRPARAGRRVRGGPAPRAPRRAARRRPRRPGPASPRSPRARSRAARGSPGRRGTATRSRARSSSRARAWSAPREPPRDHRDRDGRRGRARPDLHADLARLGARRHRQELPQGRHREAARARGAGAQGDARLRVAEVGRPDDARHRRQAQARRPPHDRGRRVPALLRRRRLGRAAAEGRRAGSRILVDDEEGGYHRNYGYVGGFWGTYSGPAGSFRGGGPGAGK